jgi:Circularly permutated YpsA SLOG family
MTEGFAREMGRPVLHVDLSTMGIEEAVTVIREWLSGLEGETLNVAGPRASGDAAIYEAVREVVAQLISLK